MKRTNVVTIGILVINFFMFFLTALLGRETFLQSLWFGGDTNTLIQAGASLGLYVGQGQYFRLVSSLFLHGGLIHLLFNSYALFLFGSIVESIYNSRRFAVVYFCSGVAGAILTQLFYPQVVSVGASGAIFGLIGLLFASGFRKNAPKRLNSVTGTALLPMIVINLLLGFTVPGINNLAHIGGLATGFVFGLVLRPFDLPSRLKSVLWTALSVICVLTALLCLLLVFLFPIPGIGQIISFSNQYAQMMKDFSTTTDPQKYSFYYELLQPYDQDTRGLMELVKSYIDSTGQQPTLGEMSTAFENWQEEVLKKYASWITKVPSP